MLTVYLSSMVFGLILILASLVLGDKELDHDADVDMQLDVEMDADVDVDADHDHDHGGPGNLPFFSVRFWTFSLSAFGMTGALLVWLSIPFAVHLPIALVTGGGIGTLIWWVFQKLKETGGAEATSLERLKGEEAEVLLGINPGGTGKIRLLVEDRHLDLLAITRDGRPLQRGEKVLVVSVDGATACVTPIARLLEEKPGGGET